MSYSRKHTHRMVSAGVWWRVNWRVLVSKLYTTRSEFKINYRCVAIKIYLQHISGLNIPANTKIYLLQWSGIKTNRGTWKFQSERVLELKLSTVRLLEFKLSTVRLLVRKYTCNSQRKEKKMQQNTKNSPRIQREFGNTRIKTRRVLKNKKNRRGDAYGGADENAIHPHRIYILSQSFI